MIELELVSLLFLLIITVSLWSLAIIIRIEKMQKTINKYKDVIETARTNAYDHYKNSAELPSKTQWEQTFKIYQLLYEALKENETK